MPNAEQSLPRARADVEDARKIAALPIARVAARLAYSAAFPAAEAYIAARTGKIAKPHTGVRSEFNRLIMDEVDDLARRAGLVGDEIRHHAGRHGGVGPARRPALAYDRAGDPHQHPRRREGGPEDEYALRITSYAARGIGTARVVTLDTVAGTFASIPLGLNGLMTAVLAPIVLGLF